MLNTDGSNVFQHCGDQWSPQGITEQLHLPHSPSPAAVLDNEPIHFLSGDRDAVLAYRTVRIGTLASATTLTVDDDLLADSFLLGLKRGRSDNELLLAGYYGTASYTDGLGLTVDSNMFEVGSGSFSSPTGFALLSGVGFNAGSGAVSLVGSDTRVAARPAV